MRATRPAPAPRASRSSCSSSAASTPEDVRRLVLLVADGDDPGALLPRWIQDREGEWVGRARQALLDATADVPVELDVALRAARRALDELGPVGLEEALAAAAKEAALPVWFAAEADALRLEGAIRTGDVAAAREVTARSPPEPEVLGRLADPGAYLLLAARAEALLGGDATLAWRLLRRYALDFPAHRGHAEAEALLPALLPRLPPELETEALRRVIAEQGTAAVDVRSAERRVKALLLDFRPGAARRFLEALGERGEDDDLEPVRAALLAAESEPDEEARRANAARVDRWLAGPTGGAEGDVLDGGAVAAEALAERLPRLDAVRRAAAVRALVVSGGLGRAVSLLAPSWSGRRRPDAGRPRGARRRVRVPRPRARGHRPRARDRDRSGGARRVGRAWPSASPRSSSPPTTRCPRGCAARSSPCARAPSSRSSSGVRARPRPCSSCACRRTPPSCCVASRCGPRAGRRRAASRGRVSPILPGSCARPRARRSPRRSTCPRSPTSCRSSRRPIPTRGSRAAAAAALFPFAERRQVRIRPLVALLRDPDASLADAVASAITRFPADAAGRALASELAEEALYEGSRQDKTALFRLFVAYRRVTGRDPGYDPSLPPERVRAHRPVAPRDPERPGRPPR